MKKLKLEKNYLLKRFFFGNEEKEFIKTVSTFIGKKKKSPTTGFNLLENNMVWPMKVAFYGENTRKGNPDYEIKLDLDEKGVAHYYEVDYGDFEIKATLKSIETAQDRKCS